MFSSSIFVDQESTVLENWIQFVLTIYSCITTVFGNFSSQFWEVFLTFPRVNIGGHGTMVLSPTFRVKG